jgi:hypothetical protein
MSERLSDEYKGLILHLPSETVLRAMEELGWLATHSLRPEIRDAYEALAFAVEKALTKSQKQDTAGQVSVRDCKNDFGAPCPECHCADGEKHAAICQEPERVYGTPPLAPADDKAEQPSRSTQTRLLGAMQLRDTAGERSIDRDLPAYNFYPEGKDE